MTRTVLRAIGCAIVVGMAVASHTAAQVVINEVHYRPADFAVLKGEDPARLEFVELYNSGASAVDLSGWSVAPAVQFVFPAGTSLAPGEYLVLARDPAFLAARVPAADGVRVFQWSSGDLSGGVIQLLDNTQPAALVMDAVAFASKGLWPTAANGGGPSLELVNPKLDNSLARVWQASLGTNGTPGAPNSRFTKAPIVLDETPARGGSSTGLAQISVTFSEPVRNVSAGDLAVAGAPAKSVTGAGAGPYVFAIEPPAPGTAPVVLSGKLIESETGNAFAGDDWQYFSPLTAIVSLPQNAQGGHGATVPVPISIAPGTGALGIDLAVEYDSSVLTVQSVAASGIALAQGFSVISNFPLACSSSPLPCRLLAIGIFGANPLVGSGELARVQFLVAGSPGATSYLNLTKVRINEDGIPSEPNNGLFTVTCTGSPNGTSCNDSNACTQTDTCQNGVCVGSNPVTCDDSNPCTVDQCVTGTGQCSHVAGNVGALCRAAAGVCDVAETCDGVSGACPADAVRAPTYQCRVSAGVCDVAEFCDGTGKSCPADAKSTALCRPSAGACDVAESCDGVSNDCPADAFQPASVQCRAAAGVCDVAEFCTGSGAACPADTKSTAVCRAAAGVCDVAESCDGVSNDCPADAFQPASVECRAAAGVCDVAELCAGTGAACPADAVAPASFQCRAAAGACDVAEFCDGSTNNCPADAKSTAVCRPAAGVCDVAESCDGVGDDCPADAFKPSTVECRGAAGVCDIAEFCDGAAKDCPADAKSTSECRPAAGVCDVAESCDGVNNDCPADAKSTSECRPAAGVCDVAESCDGVNNDCPADAFLPPTVICRAQAGVCDLAETCTGSSAACPADAKSTVVCRPAAGQCDVAESCDGVNDTCPPDALAVNGTVCNDGNECTAGDVCTNGLCGGAQVPPPAAVNNSVLLNQDGSTTEVAWTDAPGEFNVYRGTIHPRTQWTYNQGCFATGVPGPSVLDPSNPAPTTIYYYLITRKDPCGESVPGYTSTGAPEPNPNPCP